MRFYDIRYSDFRFNKRTPYGPPVVAKTSPVTDRFRHGFNLFVVLIEFRLTGVRGAVADLVFPRS